jgi:hypothetical protein
MIPEIILVGMEVLNLHERRLAMTLDARLVSDIIGIKDYWKEFGIE